MAVERGELCTRRWTGPLSGRHPQAYSRRPQVNPTEHRVPDSNYPTHSIHIRGATALVSGNASDVAIKLLGRWVSNCYEQYPIKAARSTIKLSQKMVIPEEGSAHE
ncbi:hypothetical protein PHPALM_28416 [Phytophthora palmivora]|uniref:Uncharacterized protein n=1 Tax=Phytophthora palmivora TaxID=4796 RepID=A0A2P4XA67_9STRA|nr:hypothetical protein PHPALM_28416 [Phytophthora palmivora]